jgi:mRNA-degrading endonuclease RelE of RelBE toxin-antitoxin system
MSGGAGQLVITCVTYTKKFESDLKKAPAEIVESAKEALGDLLKNPRPAWIRFEKLKGYKNPNLYSIHVTKNHSHKISFELDGSVAKLRRFGTHKKIDNDAR